MKTWGALCDSQVPRRCQCARLTLSHSSLQTVMMMMVFGDDDDDNDDGEDDDHNPDNHDHLYDLVKN